MYGIFGDKTMVCTYSTIQGVVEGVMMLLMGELSRYHTIPNYISIHIILCVCTTSGESKASAPTKRTGLVFVRFFFCWLLAFAGLIITDTIHTKYLLFSGVSVEVVQETKE